MKKIINTSLNNSYVQILSIIFFAGAATSFFRRIYYKIFPWVLSKNIIFPGGTLTPWIKAWSVQRDGIEIYVLYTFLFLIIGTAVGLVFLIKNYGKTWITFLAVVIATIVSMRLFSKVIFTPPSEHLLSQHRRMLYSFVVGLIIALMLYIHSKMTTKMAVIFLSLFLIPFCFIATSPVAMTNYVFIFSPAQKLLEGITISQIYFQYDILLSALAALWMKAGIKLVYFQLLGQVSNYLAILAIYCFSRNLFRQKSLSFLLVVSLLLIRILSAPWDPVFVFQITPLRLDLWLIPFAVIYFYGLGHWLLTLVFCLLILVHGSFGLIYAIAYLQLNILISILSFENFKISFSSAKMKKWILSLACLGASLFVSRMIFAKNMEATSWYQKIGIGFMPMADTSFFWLYPVVFASAFALLCLMKKTLTKQYLSLGFALIFFTAGNCIYFFGRSHELNLFSIAISLIFLLFFALDLLDRWLNENIQSQNSFLRNAPVIVLSFCFLAGATYHCADSIKSNLSLKIKNVATHKYQPGDPFMETQVEVDRELKEIREQIGPSIPLQFIVQDESLEFAFYQREPGNKLYCYPFTSCIFLNDLTQHLQNLINNGTYLLIDKNLAYDIFLNRMTGTSVFYTTKSQKYLLLRKQ